MLSTRLKSFLWKQFLLGTSVWLAYQQLVDYGMHITGCCATDQRLLYDSDTYKTQSGVSPSTPEAVQEHERSDNNVERCSRSGQNNADPLSV